jgi:hypothetical protein
VKFVRLAGLVLLAILLGCSKPDPTIILGNWRAESFKLEGVKLPIAPSFEVTRNEMILKSPDGVPFQKLPLAAIKADNHEIELEFRNGFGVSLVFVVDSRDRVRFKIPMTGLHVAFDRI